MFGGAGRWMFRVPVDECTEVPIEEPWNRFADDLFKSPTVKTKMTKKQKREQWRSYGLERAKDQRRSKKNSLTEGLDISAEQLCQIQELDTTLLGVAEGMDFFKRGGILSQQWVP